MFDSLFCTGEGSKGSGSPLGLQGRLAQLEERLVCNQKAGGSNPPASTLPLFVEGHGRSATGILGRTQSILLAATDILLLNVNIRAEHNNRA